MSNDKPVIPGYEALELLGAGGSGEVWAVRRADGVRLAAKLVHPSAVGTVAESDLLSRLDHDHVVRLREVLREDGDAGRQVLILDLAEGGSLADAIAARGTLTAGELVTVLTPIARTLHDLHGAGLVHSDISTGNILFTDAGKPLLADLGVSRLAGVYDDQVWATDAWAAPEVLAGGAAAPASDVWSLGAVAWACVTGTPPPPAVQRPELPEVAPHMSAAVLTLIDDAMSFDADRRPSAGEFALRLWRCATAQPAPVAGSAGARRRAVPDASHGDEAQSPAVAPGLLTRRMIRAEKEAEQQAEPAGGGIHAFARRVRSALSSALSSRRVLAPTAGALGATVLVLLATSVLPGRPTYAVGAVTGPPSTPATTAPSNPATPTTSPAAPVQTPSRIVTDLVAARARAWNQEDPQLLAHALAPNSPADKADRAALHSARQQGVDYQGLSFVPGQVSVTARDADRMTVVVPIRRSDYVVTVAASTRSQPADSRRVTLHLVKVGDHWRIHSWT